MINKSEPIDGNDQKVEFDHYSYEVYRRPEIANSFDKARFGGAIGSYFHNHQLNIIISNLTLKAGMNVLDLGAGTGRTAIPLKRKGVNILAADYSWPMLEIAKQKCMLQGDQINFIRTDAHDLPFTDASFDAVISFRMLMHVKNWKKTLAEICRVSSGKIIIDIPPVFGFAGLAPIVHPLIKSFNRHHQPYRIFRISCIRKELEKNDYSITTIDRHLVLPFGLHRFIGSVRFTQTVETILSTFGLTDLMGAPVTIVAERNQNR